MEFKTSSADTDNADNFHSRAGKMQENVSKFYATINDISRNMRKDDWAYLQRHPEIRAIIRVIVSEAVKDKPENIYFFAAELFQCENEKKLVDLINKQLQWVNEQLRGGAWNPADGIFNFPESSESEVEHKCSNKPMPGMGIEDEPDLVCPENFRPKCN
ncbi:hypothetical protein KR074_001837 [Drosophila pseudoananassae]|nr:hypothetical protein KR074_001837 [Drosophila pseudoananassae]